MNVQSNERNICMNEVSMITPSKAVLMVFCCQAVLQSDTKWETGGWRCTYG
jgi:hypothetical protein